MKKLYNRFFHVPTDGKVNDKALLAQLVMTVMVIVGCLAAMSLSAYAYFTYNISSEYNTLKTTGFKAELEISVEDENGNVLGTVAPETSNNKTFRLTGLEVGKWYTVTVRPSSLTGNAKTGFMVITAEGCDEIYHTAQLGTNVNAPGKTTQQLKFRLMITDTTDVIFKAHWGTSSYFGYNKTDLYVDQKDDVTMIVNGAPVPTPEQNGGQGEQNGEQGENGEQGGEQGEGAEPADTPEQSGEPASDETVESTEQAEQDSKEIN